MPLISFLLFSAALVFDVDTGRPMHYTTDPVSVPPCAVFRNVSSGRVDTVGSVTVSNYFAEAVSVPVKLSLAPGGTARFPIDISKVPSGRVRGIWRAHAHLSGGIGTDREKVDFAFIPENRVTPRVPRGKYRIGMHCHMGRFPMEQQPMLLDAIVALGAKLVRVTGFEAKSCWKDPAAEPDFSRTDAFVAMLKERGLSMNVFCWPNPSWMIEDKERARRWPTYIRTRTKKGLMGKFSEMLAARYGKDIDYVEPSNEPDFWDINAMSIDEYLDYQREVYQGIKRGCKDIQVLSPGWAQPDSSHHAVKLKGLHERFMAEAKDAFDIHAIHGHGTLAAYEKQIEGRFFPARKRFGVTAPWYPNETAATGVNGAEDEVAAIVWRKILWCRAHGAVDYIWYNLVATDNKPKSTEQWFGLFTRSFHPRAPFASYAALTHLLHGLDYDGTVHEGKGRYLYRWRGTVGGRPRTVFVGWDDNADTPARIRFASDCTEVKKVDLMGNAFAAESSGGSWIMELARQPSAIVFDGSAGIVPDAADVAKVSVPERMSRIVKADIRNRAPDFQLMVWWQVQERYAGNWETSHRTWKGPEDLAANIYVGYSDGDLVVRFNVRDDKRAPLDAVSFTVEPPDQSRRHEFRAVLAKEAKVLPNGRISCDMRVPISEFGFTEDILKRGFLFQAKVYDDDGVADDIDFWMETRRCWISVGGIGEGKR